jgi:hypothetical protein
MPDQDAVVAITADTGDMPLPSALLKSMDWEVVAITADTGDMPAELTAIWEKLYPAFQAEALPADTAGQDHLKQLVASLEAHPAKK